MQRFDLVGYEADLVPSASGAFVRYTEASDLIDSLVRECRARAEETDRLIDVLGRIEDRVTDALRLVDDHAARR